MIRGKMKLSCLLAALGIVGAFGASPSRAAAKDAKSALPAGAAVKGWKQIGPTALYNSQNLFNLVDGEAEAILAYSFVSCAHAEYAPVNSKKPVLTIDIYDMKDPLDAFGLFGSDRISGAPAKIGAEGVGIPPSGLNFWQDKFVVRTAIVQVNPAARAAQLAFAKACSSKIGGNAGLPSLVKSLPPGYQPRSEKYVRKNVAGHAFLSNAITARYPALGQGAELFIAQYPAPNQAKAALESYRKYEKSGTGMAALKGIGTGGFIVLDRFAKTVAVTQKGNFLIGADHVRTPAAAQTLLKAAFAKAK